MKITMEFDNKNMFIIMLIFSHLMIYDSKTIVISEDAKSIMKSLKLLYGDLLKKLFVFEKYMIRQKDLKHTWYAYIKNIINPENIMGIYGEKLLFILDNTTPDIIDAAKASCTDEYNHCIIIEDEE